MLIVSVVCYEADFPNIEAPQFPAIRGETMKIKCDPEGVFRLTGSDVITCTEEGEWSYSSIPECTPAGELQQYKLPGNTRINLLPGNIYKRVIM